MDVSPLVHRDVEFLELFAEALVLHFMLPHGSVQLFLGLGLLRKVLLMVLLHHYQRLLQYLNLLGFLCIVIRFHQVLKGNGSQWKAGFEIQCDQLHWCQKLLKF